MNSKKQLVALAAILFVSYTSFAQTTWTVDKAHSRIGFSVTHLIIAEVDGNFKEYSGEMIVTGPDFSGAKINFTVDVASIFTDNEMRDNHLRSDDFFNAEKYPHMKFISTDFRKTQGNNYVLEGALTIRDVTRNVRFNVTFGGLINDPWGATKAGFKATTTINRFDYNLKWNTLTEAGGAVVSPEVNIQLKLEFQLQK